MSYQTFLTLHLIAVLLMTGVTFAAFAAPHPDNRQRMLMASGSLSLLVFLTGFGVMGVMGLGFPGWAVVKVVCWLALSGLTGMAFRMPDRASTLQAVAAAAIVVAVLMVVYRPF